MTPLEDGLSGAEQVEQMRLFYGALLEHPESAASPDTRAIVRLFAAHDSLATSLEQALERERQLREALNILGYPISFDTPAPEIFEHAKDLARKRGWGAEESG